VRGFVTVFYTGFVCEARASQGGCRGRCRRTGQVLQQVSSPIDTLTLARAAANPIPAQSLQRRATPARERERVASLGGLCTKARADAPLGCVHLLLRHHTSLDPDGLGVALVPCHDLTHQSLDLLSRARLGVERVQVPELRGRRLQQVTPHAGAQTLAPTMVWLSARYVDKISDPPLLLHSQQLRREHAQGKGPRGNAARSCWVQRSGAAHL
jgi:hypothetical protein